MTNVVCLRAQRCARASAGLPPQYVEEVDQVQLRSRMIDVQSRAKEEILRSILLLDIAAQHARQIAKRTDDPALNKNLSAQISLVEQLLQIAREMALKL
ncbi:MAG: hypothetical protein Q8R78_00890 [Candidatus Omnitrophota bacterium]|nr:hypothetical protein [Candidatus Omnitrophota bacterium]